MGQKFAFNNCANGWHPGFDTLNLILLAIFNSQNIGHLFPGFLTNCCLVCLQGEEGKIQVFSPVASAKPTRAAHQPYMKENNY
jgi:hypothetical protein